MRQGATEPSVQQQIKPAQTSTRMTDSKSTVSPPPTSISSEQYTSWTRKGSEDKNGSGGASRPSTAQSTQSAAAIVKVDFDASGKSNTVVRTTTTAGAAGAAAAGSNGGQSRDKEDAQARLDKFKRLLSANPIDLNELQKACWKGIPKVYRHICWKLLSVSLLSSFSSYSIFLSMVRTVDESKLVRAESDKVLLSLFSVFTNKPFSKVTNFVYLDVYKDYLPLNLELQEKTVEQKRQAYWEAVTIHYGNTFIDSHHDMLRQVR